MHFKTFVFASTPCPYAIIFTMASLTAVPITHNIPSHSSHSLAVTLDSSYSRCQLQSVPVTVNASYTRCHSLSMPVTLEAIHPFLSSLTVACTGGCYALHCGFRLYSTSVTYITKLSLISLSIQSSPEIISQLFHTIFTSIRYNHYPNISLEPNKVFPSGRTGHFNSCILTSVIQRTNPSYPP